MTLDSDYVLAFIGSLLISFVSTPLMIKIANVFRIYDVPNEKHKAHTHAVPYLGGIAVVLSVVVVSGIGISLRLEPRVPIALLASSILLPAVLLSVVGLVDDIKKLSPWPRFLIQTIAGVFTSVVLATSSTISNLFDIPWLDFAMTTIWIVGIVNSINFLDNHDGVVAGIVATTSFVLFAISTMSSQYLIATLALTLSGSCAGFLFWNKTPAKIYMGDSGALFLGALLAGLLIRFKPQDGDRFSTSLIPILLVALPILDTSIAVISRLIRGKSPFEGGRDHLAHRLLRERKSSKTTAQLLWLINGVFASLAFLLLIISQNYRNFVLVFALTLWVYLFLYFWKIAHE